MNFSFIWKTSLQIQDIWKDEKFSEWLLSPMDQKTFQELVFKAVKNRKRSGSRSPAGQIDWPKSVFLQDKVTLSDTLKTTINEVSRDKTKVPDWFFSRNVSLVYVTAELIHNRFSFKLMIKTLRPHTCMQKKQLRVCFDVLIRYSLLFSSEIILKQLFPSGWVNIHFAFGE